MFALRLLVVADAAERVTEEVLAPLGEERVAPAGGGDSLLDHPRGLAANPLGGRSRPARPGARGRPASLGISKTATE